MLKKTKKKVLISIALALILISTIFINVYFLFLHHYKGKNIDNPWNETNEFVIEEIATIQKEKGKDFVILNLADIQLCDLEDFFNYRIIRNEISYLIKNTKPDLITLTGDQTWSNENLISLTTLIQFLDSFKIPYAPIFGNHDYGNQKNSAVASVNYCCDLYESSKYCLFKRGPSNLGSLGNYIINIIEENKIFKTLYFLNSGYEESISDKQIEWFKWNANGIKTANNGEYSQGMCFLHKPLPEYMQAFAGYISNDPQVEAINDVYVNYSLDGSFQNGFFDIAKTVSVTDIVCGHQHGNNFTLKYEDIRLTFALKTGELGGYYDDGKVNLNGATLFSLGDVTDIKNIYVDSNMFHISNALNSYLN